MGKSGRFLKTAAALCAAFFLSGCSLFGGELIAPPRPSGEMQEIKAAIEKEISGTAALKYPTSGDYRSAIILHDISGNDIDDAVVFYSRKEEDSVLLYLAAVVKNDGEWQTLPPLLIPAAGVEKVCFADFNGDGKDETVVGWTVVGSAQKQVAVYGCQNGNITQHLMEDYTEFLCCDLDTDGASELFVLEHGTDTAAARLYTLGEDGAVAVDGCVCDGGVQSYAEIKEGKLAGGKPCIYADGKKAQGVVTQIFFTENAKLKNPLYDNVLLSADVTLRAENKPSRDINGDSVDDIPFADSSGFTKWCDFDGEKLIVVLTAYMTPSESFYYPLPKSLYGSISVAADGKTGEARFYAQVPEGGKTLLFTAREIRAGDRVPDGFITAAKTKTHRVCVKTEENAILSEKEMTAFVAAE